MNIEKGIDRAGIILGLAAGFYSWLNYEPKTYSNEYEAMQCSVPEDIGALFKFIGVFILCVILSKGINWVIKGCRE